MEKKHSHKGLLIAALCLILVLVLIAAAYGYMQSKLSKIQFDEEIAVSDTGSSEASSAVTEPEPEDREEAVQAEEKLEDEDVMNLLLLGTDERTREFSENARADAIMVLSLNTREHTIKLVSIERGIGVPIPGRNDDWLTHTFRYGGAQLTMDTVNQCFDLDIDRYVRVNFHVFEDAIDAIGGVDITLTQGEANELNRHAGNAEYQPVQAGSNHMNGFMALQYSRIRHIDNDWHRIERQRNVVQAALQQVKSQTLVSLNELANTILPMIRTNLTKSEIVDLAKEVPGFIRAGIKIEDMTIPTQDTCWNSVGADGRKLIGVDFEANAEILNHFFYGESEKLLN